MKRKECSIPLLIVMVLVLIFLLSKAFISSPQLSSRLHKEPPEQPRPYPNATKVSNTIEMIAASYKSRFETTDSANAVLCFYEQELRKHGWSSFDDDYANDSEQQKENKRIR